MTTYDGRLELTWTNKHLALLAHEDGSYEWLSPADYRVAEVRLLHDEATVGEVGGKRARDNLLIRGDALNALTSLTRLPEFASELLGKVRLAYLDPPFNTQQSWLQYEDNLEHSVWLTMMRDRLLQIRELLAPNGSLWVHCDDSEGAHLRRMMDELFPNQWVGTVVWQKRYSRDNRPAIGAVHDYIHAYSPLGGDWKNHRNRITRTAAKEYRNPNDDPRGPWRAIPITAQAGHATPAQFYDITLPSGRVVGPPPGNAWRFSEERFDALNAQGRIYFGLDGNATPNTIRYLDEDEGLVPWTWWPNEEVGHNDESKKEILDLFPDKEPFDTPKPERLMQRIIQIATNPGEIVLDCFAGSATTAAVAQKMGRTWIAVERDAGTLRDFAVPRLTKVVAGEDPGGITSVEVLVGDELPDGVKPGQAKAAAKVLNIVAKAGTLDDVNGLDEDAVKEVVKLLRAADKTVTETRWHGGGGFRVLEVAQSMFEADDGMVFLADWMTNGALAEATAAQLGYSYEDDPPFAGRKGRARLAVVDGVVNESVVRLLVTALPEGERVVVCGTGIDTDARPVLRELRPGSTLRKIPAALLAEYRSASQLSLIPTTATEPQLNGGPLGAPNGTQNAGESANASSEVSTAPAGG
jgi:adenine-specific DNA-methyltransferase